MPQVESTFNIIDVLTLVDAETIVSQGNLSTDPQHPTLLPNNGSGTVYMVTTLGNAISGQAGSELNLGAEVDDIIRWRSSSLTGVADYKCFLYGITFSAGGDLLSAPTFNVANVNMPYPVKSWPQGGVESEKSADSYWQVTVLDVGKATYQFVVAIYDRHASLKGYVTWDPFITIKND